MLDLLVGAARAWTAAILTGKPDERARRRLQATVATTWVALCAGFLAAPAVDRALLDPAPRIVPSAAPLLFTTGAMAAGLGCLLAVAAGFPLFTEVIGAARGEERRRIVRPLLPAMALLVVELAGLAGLALWRQSYPPLNANPQFPAIFTAALLVWTGGFLAMLVATGLGPALALTRAAPPARSLRLGGKLALPIAILLTIATGATAAGAITLLPGNGYDWFVRLFTVGVLLVAVTASGAALVSAARGSRIARRGSS